MEGTDMFFSLVYSKIIKYYEATYIKFTYWI